MATVGEERVEIELKKLDASRIEAVVAGRRYELEAREVEPGVFWLLHQDRSLEAAVTAEEGRGYSVRVGGKRVRVRFLDPRERLRRGVPRTGKGTAQVRALMPGRVVRLLVEAGSKVEHGQGLFVIEAMKMQNEAVAPVAGRVESVLVEEGAAVNAGDLLATIGPDDGS